MPKTNVLLAKPWLWILVVTLVIVGAVQALFLVHRESLTFDEGDHSFAGYMMWKTHDYGLNPEHPPLVKLLATAPLLGKPLWIPPLQGREFKAEAYLDGRDWLARNDGASQHLLFRMRAAAEVLAIGLALMIFFATRRWFGDLAALIALALVVFDPNILTNSALVTTDIGVSLFFVASIYAFYRYVIHPGWQTLTLAGVAAGLLLATKHSGVLLAPMLASLVLYELWLAAPDERWATFKRLTSALAVVACIAVVILWSFYGFRYAARPAGLNLSTSLALYAAPLSPSSRFAIMTIARLHLLPESYLMGLVDVKRMANSYPTYIFGKVYAHGVWWYFPAVILIKTTIGLLAMTALAVFALLTGKLKQHREVFYALTPAAIYLGVAMAAGMNIGARHLLPMYAFLMIFAAAGVAKLSAQGRVWAMVAAALLVAHMASSAAVFPNEMTYANELAGGPRNLHNLLSDANVDWAQQLYQVKHWQDVHPSEDCWFVYFARPEIDPATYGIHCHAMPTLDTFWLGGSELIPAQIKGTVLISAGDLSGCEWPSSYVNPYREFLQKRPDEVIDNVVFVYRGDFDSRRMAAESRVDASLHLLMSGRLDDARQMARDAVGFDSTNILGQTLLGDSASALGSKQEAAQAYEAAIQALNAMDENAREGYLKELQGKLTKLR